jgi:hypothetical protein
VSSWPVRIASMHSSTAGEQEDKGVGNFTSQGLASIGGIHA